MTVDKAVISRYRCY